MKKPLIEVRTEHAPVPKGPYPQAIKAGDYLFVSGQLPTDPITGKIVGTDVKAQAHQVIDNIEAVLAAEQVGLDRVASVLVTLSNLEDLPEFNRAYAERFHYDPRPARDPVESRLPEGMLVKMSCIAYLGE